MHNIGEKLVYIGALFILIALGIFIKDNYEDYQAGKDSSKALAVLNEYTDNIDNVENKDNNGNKLKKVDGYDYYGVIALPSINIELPLLSEWDYNRLKKGPCIYYGSIEENNLVICGHSYRTHFKYLSKLEIGHHIVIADLNGNKYVYEVVDKVVIDPHDSTEVIETGYDLVIFSCFNSGTQRMIIHANRVN